MATSCCGATRISAHPLMEKWCDARIRASEEGERIPVLVPLVLASLPAPCAEAPTSVVAAMAWGRASCKTGALQFLQLWHLCTLLFANHGDCSSRCATTTTTWNAVPGRAISRGFLDGGNVVEGGMGKGFARGECLQANSIHAPEGSAPRILLQMNAHGSLSCPQTRRPAGARHHHHRKGKTAQIDV